MQRYNSKEDIINYVLSLGQKDIDYEITKYFFGYEVIEKDVINYKFSGRKYMLKRRRNTPTVYQAFRKKRTQNDYQVIPRWSNDSRHAFSLIVELNQNLTIIPLPIFKKKLKSNSKYLGKQFIITSENFSCTDRLPTAIARITLMECYFKKDWLPNQI